MYDKEQVDRDIRLKEYKGRFNLDFSLDVNGNQTNCEKEPTGCQPASSNEIVGNGEAVNFVKKWLLDWKQVTDHAGDRYKGNRRKVIMNDSDSDFCPDMCDESDEEDGNFGRGLLIFGPVGCGKTSSVYAIAQELHYKVIHSD